jgi:hypothetical protein
MQDGPLASSCQVLLVILLALCGTSIVHCSLLLLVLSGDWRHSVSSGVSFRFTSFVCFTLPLRTVWFLGVLLPQRFVIVLFFVCFHANSGHHHHLTMWHAGYLNTFKIKNSTQTNRFDYVSNVC